MSVYAWYISLFYLGDKLIPNVISVDQWKYAMERLAQ